MNKTMHPIFQNKDNEMKIIEFKPDLLHPTQENEVGLDNGFILNAMDPLLSQYKQELFPESVPVNNLESLSLSLIAYDTVNDYEEWVSIYYDSTSLNEDTYYVLWRHVENFKTNTQDKNINLLTKIFVEPNVKTYSLSFSTLESAIEFCINKLISGGYQFDKEYESWMKVE